MYDALFFDLDGTLVDTEALAIASGLEAFRAHGHPVEERFLHDLIGKDAPTSEAIIRAKMPGADLEAVQRDWQAGFVAAVEAGLTLKPGAAELLSARVAPMVLVTSSGREGAHRKLKIAGIAEHFAHVVSLDDVTAAKPDPAPYLLAAKLLGVDPKRCLAFEDSETGAESAHRAGCTVVQVPDILPSEGQWADHLAPDLIAGARMAGLL
ncbi:HAD family phosphatase [Xinfangfangia sp. CPCC 101601]|uniref:HAD family phosphatase n=1 Tax=Pseudogemmobacter lacusdianii TaxID=3069608 RepID=A0ABU0VZ60_9RHOB|nr:HAD family phosphatase [Xinfangfangia sp. CPCC 101601]MDQ2066823.1 HAD family phosphatase [Xinfangfangia sp. CPCC 101601]